MVQYVLIHNNKVVSKAKAASAKESFAILEQDRLGYPGSAIYLLVGGQESDGLVSVN